MAGLVRQRWKEGSAWIGRLFMRRLREAAVVVAIGVILYMILRVMTAVS